MYVSVLEGGWVERYVWMGVGCPYPPVRNDIVTPRHLFIFADCLKMSSWISWNKIIYDPCSYEGRNSAKRCRSICEMEMFFFSDKCTFESYEKLIVVGHGSISRVSGQ